MKAVRFTVLMVALLALLLAGSACDDVDSTAPDTNVPPVTTISGGPEPFDQNVYLVKLNWYGEDVDGSVESYEFAWDDTAEWFNTVLTESTYVVSSDTCCLFDTLLAAAGQDSIVERFFRYHTFFVRAVDNRGAKDPSPAYLTFNSTTVAPFSRITRGPGMNSSSGRAVSIHWEGADPDAPDNAVAAYEYFHVTKGVLRERYGYVDGSMTRRIWNRLGWIRVGADTTAVVLRNLETGFGADGANRHLFFIRSIDDAGAVEQIPVEGVNYREWGAADTTTGVVVIRSNVMGTATTGSAHVGQIFEGTRVFFSWRANLGSYDGVPTGYGHTYDNPLWTAWDLLDTRYPRQGDFVPLRGPHTFYARVRDEAGEVVSASFPFEVYAGPRNLDTTSVLVLSNFHIESARGEFYPKPEKYESFWTDTLLINFNHDFYDARTERVNDPPIRLMSRSTTIILPTDDWEGESGQHPIVAQWHDNRTNPIWSYVDAGGNLLICGFFPDWNFLPDNDFIDTGYVPEADPCFRYSSPKSCGSALIWYHPLLQDSLPHPLYEYCAVETTWLDETADYMWGAKALVSGLPDLHVDSLRSKNFTNFLSPGIKKGLWKCERITYRDDMGVIPLYGFSRTATPLTVEPEMNKRAVAIYIPSDGVRGNVVYMGMPDYFFKPGETKRLIETLLTTYMKETMRE
ncbi:MAG: hypothetical protein ABIH26_06895 [Candidatus Eisenbacteria bacterium]